MVFKSYGRRRRHIFDRYAKKKDKKRRDPRKEREAKLMTAFEHHQMYQQHLQRIRQATSVVDSRVPSRRKAEQPQRELSFTEIVATLRDRLQSNNSALTFTKWASAEPPLSRSGRWLAGGGGGGGGDDILSDRNTSTLLLRSRQDSCCDAQRKLSKVYRKSNHSLPRGEQRNSDNSTHSQNCLHAPDQFRSDCATPLRQSNSFLTYGRTNESKPTSNYAPCSPHTLLARKRAALRNMTPRERAALKITSPRYCACMTSTGGEWPPPIKANQDSLEELGRKHDIPVPVLQRFQQLTITNNVCMLRKLLRPRIFLDLEVSSQRPLGRLVIQLFTEACPEVVLEFVRICTLHASDRFSFTRLFPPLWMEGELALTDNKTLTARNIEHDTSVLNHGCGPGILSFPSRYVRGSKRRFLSFSVSFKPLDVLNGKRIAFGSVQRGHWILDTVQDYGSNNGKPSQDIMVTKCGLL